jgi:DNA-binding transcriptional ArsR family regulator
VTIDREYIRPMDSDPQLSQDLVFDLLSSPRRRMVLYYLRRYGEASTVTELAEEIAALEYDVDVEELSRQQQKRVYVSLYQTHVPKLAEAGVVDYDKDTGEVTLTDRARAVDIYLTPRKTPDYPWHYHYLVLAGLGVAFLLLEAFGGLDLVGLPLIAGAVTFMFAASGAAQLLYRRYYREQLPAELTEDGLR